MAADRDRTVSAETVHRMASELIGLDLNDIEIHALLPLLRSLMDEIDDVGPDDRDGAEPAMTFEDEGWTP
ncbi:MAG: hypothetical protein ABI353_15115 [Isosphaeraceae bacterium]